MQGKAVTAVQPRSGHDITLPILSYKANKNEYNIRNCSLAFHVAYKELGIPPLLDAEDVVKHAHPDQRSILTYLSQFYHKLEGNASG